MEFSNFFNLIVKPNEFALEKTGDMNKLNPHYREFLKNNKKFFNQSQHNALQYVAWMDKSGLSLIQGPPGTGKTHTIQGLISMAVACHKGDPNDKVLVCTPSNAACDEIVYRLARYKLMSKRGHAVPPNMVRIGAFDYEPHKLVKRHTLDYLIDEEQQKCGQTVDINQINKNCAELDRIDLEIHKFENEIKDNTAAYPEESKKKIEQLRLQKSKLLSETNSLRQMKKSASKNANLLESEILRKSKIILTTLSMSGIDLLERMEFNFSHLIIDEACQSTEVSTLIPFTHNIKKVILVGDQNQLPATVFADNSEKTRFNRSLYERFLDNEIPRFVLNIQYRMYEAIREFPSQQFYNDEICDAEMIKKRVVNDLGGTIPRLMFYDLAYTKSTSGAKSKSNDLEADFVTKIFLEAVEFKGQGNFREGLKIVKGEVGIITPYKQQAKVIKDKIEREIRKRLKKYLKKNKKKNRHNNEESKDSSSGPGSTDSENDMLNINHIVEINTVDSFQGREKDTIIISCVRANQGRDTSIGFLNDYRRMNVAITRAKNFLWIVGHAHTLNIDRNWGDLIRHCFSKNAIKCFEKPEPIANILQDKVDRISDSLYQN